MRVDIVETPELGNRSYVMSDGLVSVVVDPQRDLDQVEVILGERGTPRSFPRRTYDDLARDRRPGDVVLDVRRATSR
jgi:hydroxyacylglutathione hydrolase